MRSQRSRKRPEREESFSISSTKLYQEDFLHPNQSTTYPLTMNFRFGNSNKEHSIGVETNPHQIKLEYNITNNSGEEEEFSYTVSVEWTECNFGGQRPWFRCPSNGCNERVEKLYKPLQEGFFACRHCYDITYRRCNISGKPTEIAMYKKKKIAEKLDSEDADVSVGAWPPTKPKNMHWDTFEELEKQWQYWDEEHKKRFQNSLRKFNDEIIENLSEII
jgi:hypothetical protein